MPENIMICHFCEEKFKRDELTLKTTGRTIEGSYIYQCKNCEWSMKQQKELTDINLINKLED